MKWLIDILILKDIRVDISLIYMAKLLNALDLLIPCMRMSINGEQIMTQRKEDMTDEKQFNIINCFPIKKSVIPKYIDIIDIDVSVAIANFGVEDKKYCEKNKMEVANELREDIQKS
jgi:hypothetical protein